MEAGSIPGGVNAPHPDDQDPSSFFDVGGLPDEPTLDEGSTLGRALPEIPGVEPPVEGSIDSAQVAADLAASRERAAAALAEVPKAETPADAPPAPQEPAAAVPEPGPPPPATDPPPPPAPPATRAPRGTTEPPRQYAVLREIAMTPELIDTLKTASEVEGYKPMTVYLMLEPGFPGRAPKQVGKDVFKKHYRRLGVGLQGQAPLVLYAITHSAWQRMVLAIKPRVIDDNIEIEGDE